MQIINTVESNVVKAHANSSSDEIKTVDQPSKTARPFAAFNRLRKTNYTSNDAQ